MTVFKDLKCWEIKKCGRQSGGKKEDHLGECVTSKEGMGHSCWACCWYFMWW
jgi:hypothetical protein